MIKKLALGVAICGILSSCEGTSKVQKLSDKTYQVAYTEHYTMSSPGLVNAYMSDKIKEVCPHGYTKLGERTSNEGKMPSF